VPVKDVIALVVPVAATKKLVSPNVAAVHAAPDGNDANVQEVPVVEIAPTVDPLATAKNLLLP